MEYSILYMINNYCIIDKTAFIYDMLIKEAVK